MCSSGILPYDLDLRRLFVASQAHVALMGLLYKILLFGRMNWLYTATVRTAWPKRLWARLRHDPDIFLVGFVKGLLVGPGRWSRRPSSCTPRGADGRDDAGHMGGSPLPEGVAPALTASGPGSNNTAARSPKARTPKAADTTVVQVKDSEGSRGLTVLPPPSRQRSGAELRYSASAGGSVRSTSGITGRARLSGGDSIRGGGGGSQHSKSSKQLQKPRPIATSRVSQRPGAAASFSVKGDAASADPREARVRRSVSETGGGSTAGAAATTSRRPSNTEGGETPAAPAPDSSGPPPRPKIKRVVTIVVRRRKVKSDTGPAAVPDGQAVADTGGPATSLRTSELPLSALLTARLEASGGLATTSGGGGSGLTVKVAKSRTRTGVEGPSASDRLGHRNGGPSSARAAQLGGSFAQGSPRRHPKQRSPSATEGHKRTAGHSRGDTTGSGLASERGWFDAMNTPKDLKLKTFDGEGSVRPQRDTLSVPAPCPFVFYRPHASPVTHVSASEAGRKQLNGPLSHAQPTQQITVEEKAQETAMVMAARRRRRRQKYHRVVRRETQQAKSPLMRLLLVATHQI